MRRARHDDQLGMRHQRAERALVDAQLIELPVHEPRRHGDALQRRRQVELRETAQRRVLCEERVAARPEIGTGVVRQGRFQNPFGEPQPVIGQRRHRLGREAVGGKTRSAWERGARPRDETGQRRGILRARVGGRHKPAHRVADQQHGAVGRSIPHRTIHGREGLIQGEGLGHARAVRRQIHRGGRDAALGQMLELGPPHRGGGADAVHEDDVNHHSLRVGQAVPVESKGHVTTRHTAP